MTGRVSSGGCSGERVAACMMNSDGRSKACSLERRDSLGLAQTSSTWPISMRIFSSRIALKSPNPHDSGLRKCWYHSLQNSAISGVISPVSTSPTSTAPAPARLMGGPLRVTAIAAGRSGCPADCEAFLLSISVQLRQAGEVAANLVGRDFSSGPWSVQIGTTDHLRPDPCRDRLRPLHALI